MMKKKYTQTYILFFIVFGEILFSENVNAKTDYDAISKCFWIDAPIHELAKDMKLHDLQFFTQSRIGWLAGFMQANRESAEFNAAFQVEIERRKAAGIAMKEELRRAIQTGNNRRFQELISKAVECDKVMGIKTEFIPQIGK